MTKELQTHTTTIALSEPVPPEVAVGAAVVLKVKVSCSAECDLRGTPVTIAAPDGVVATGALAAFDAEVNESGDIAFKAPQRVGEHAWTVTVEPHETSGIRHEPSTLPVNIAIIPEEYPDAAWTM